MLILIRGRHVSITVIHSEVQLRSDFFTLDLSPDMTLADVKGLIESELGAPTSTQNVLHNEQPLTDNTKSLRQLSINHGDILALAIRAPSQQNARRQDRQQGGQQSGQQGGQEGGVQVPDAERVRLHMLGDATLMTRMRQERPELAEAASDPARFETAWREEQRKAREIQQQQEQEQRLLEDDPFNVEAQTKIEKLIRQQQIARNLETAMEENPESFARVTMLYIDVTVNNIPIKAFVDSGAQTTIMSPDAAERCNITHLIDTRWGGIARGVGTAKIIGRVHHAYIQLGQYQAASSFTVMEGKDVDLLLGLDMLKKHRMCIDLQESCLKVHDDEIEFLPEHEIPKMMEQALDKEPKVPGPGGSTIGAETGTVETPSSSSQGLNTNAAIQPPQSATQPAAPQTHQRSAFGQAQPITEQSIAQVMELGFSRDEALTALRQVNGNVELAIGLLL